MPGHYINLQTAAPVSSQVAKKARKQTCLLRFYFALALVLAVAWHLAELPQAERAEQYHHISSAWFSYAPFLALIYLMLPPFNRFGAFLRALREWFMYNWQMLDEPGVFRSPVGSASRRLIPIYLLAFLLAAPFAQALTPQFAGSPTEIPTSAVDQSLILIALVLQDGWQLLFPVLTLLSTTFLLTAPLLCNARVVGQSARGSEFKGYLQRLDSLEPAAR